MVDFCVFFNSRGRVQLLKHSLESLLNTVLAPQYIKILIRIDDDDIETIGFSKQYNRDNVRFVVGPRPTNLIKSYNELVKLEEAQWYFVWNDDCIMISDKWDKHFWDNALWFKECNAIKDNILLLGATDTSVDRPEGKKYASFMAIHRDAIQCLGKFMDERFVTLGADSAIDRVYKSVDRVVNCPEILIDHVFHSSIFNVLNPDKTAAEYREKAWTNSPDPFEVDINEDINKLKDYINKC